MALLKQCRVIDLGGHKTSACSSFLASLGAEVISVTSTDALTTEKFPLDLRGKKSVAINLDTDDGVDLLKSLIKTSDFFIEANQPGYLKTKSLDYDALSEVCPTLIHIAITPFGQTGPYSQFKGNELIASAMGGTLATCGYPDDTPVLEAKDACCFHANGVAAMGAMMAHRERGLSGKGQFIDISIQEVAASRNTNNLLCWQFDKRTLPRAGDKVQFGAATVRVVWQLADGYCFHSLMTGKFGAPANSALSLWMTEDGFDNPMSEVDWDKYDRSSLPSETRLIWEAAIDKFFKSKTKHDVNTEGRRRGIRATVANAPEDVIADEHLQVRKFLSSVKYADKTILHPDYFVKLTRSDYRLNHSVPTPGENTRDALSSVLNLADDAIADLQQAGVIL